LPYRNKGEIIMVRIAHRLLVSAGVAALIQTYGSPVRAVTAAEAERSGALEEIVVTARKRAESLQTTPVSVSAISAENLAAAQLTRVDDLSALAPNLTITANTNSIGVTQTTIRGIVNADSNLLNDSPVAIYLDGVVIARATGALMGLTDLERVEVLRGPQGTLFGRNTTGGAVNLFTKAPGDEFQIQQKLGYGNDNDITSRTTIDTGKFGPFTAKVAYALRRYDGYERNLQTDESEGFGSVDSDAFFVALHGDLTDRFTLDYKFDYDDEEGRTGFSQVTDASALVQAVFANSVARGGVPLVVSPDRVGETNQTDLGPSTLEVQGHSLTLNYSFSDAFKIKSISAYRKVDTLYNVVIGSGPLFASIGNGTQATGFAPYSIGQIDLLTNRENNEQNQKSQELQFSGQLARFNYVAGLYWFDENVRLSSAGSLAAFVPAVPPFLNPPNFPLALVIPQAVQYSGGSESAAAYSNVSYTPSILDEKLELTVGLRYTEDKKELNQVLFNAAAAPTGSRSADRDFSDFSQSASVKYQWTEDLMTYVRWSEAYKAGGFNPRFTGDLGNNGFSGINSFDPENASSYELGIKSELLDRRLRLNVTGFYTQYDDLQVSVLQPSPAGVLTVTNNAGKATYQGAELEFVVLPATGLEISGSAGYVDPEFDEYKTTDAVTGAPIDIANIAKFGSTSKLTTNLRVQYILPPLAIGDLTLAANWSRLSERYYGSNPLTAPRLELIKAPVFNNVGAQITLSEIPIGSLDNALTVQLYGRNLLNKYQRVDGIDFGSQLGYATNGYGPGRQYGIGVTMTF
jgi:iron complex outermembrane receptor protein